MNDVIGNNTMHDFQAARIRELEAKCAELERERKEYEDALNEEEADSSAFAKRVIVQHDELIALRSALAAAEQRVASLEGAIKQADEMHLGRCASSEPFKAIDYRNHACDARDILRDALRTPSGEKGEATLEQRCASLEGALREALGFIQDVGVGEDDDIETMAMIERLSGRLTATLAYTDTPAVGVRVLLLGMTYDQFKDVMAQCRHEAVDNGSGDPPAGYEQLEPDSAALRIADNCWHGGMDAMETAVLNWFFDQQQALRTPSGEKGEAT